MSGKLYKDALVMFDRQTGTLWTQVDGSALRGPLAGNRLVQVSGLQTTWNVWKKLHPDTLVLLKPPSVRGSSYEGYFSDPECRGLSGTRGDSRLHGKTIVIGVHAGDDAIAVPLSTLRERRLVAAELARDPIVVFYSHAGHTASVFRATLQGGRLSFRVREAERQMLVEDAETRSLWSPLEGRALAGPLQGQRLEPLPYMQSYWYAWSAYRPYTRVVP